MSEIKLSPFTSKATLKRNKILVLKKFFLPKILVLHFYTLCDVMHSCVVSISLSSVYGQRGDCSHYMFVILMTCPRKAETTFLVSILDLCHMCNFQSIFLQHHQHFFPPPHVHTVGIFFECLPGKKPTAQMEFCS